MKLQIEIDRSMIFGLTSIQVSGLLFFVFYLSGMLFCFTFPIESPKLEDALSVIILCSALLLASLLIYIDEKKHGSTQQLQIEFSRDYLILQQNRKKIQLPLTDIKEVVQVMLFNRIYPEKGKYKVVIKRRGHRSLKFMSTEQEYEKHVSFAETDLAKFYHALRSQGIKCC